MSTNACRTLSAASTEEVVFGSPKFLYLCGFGGALSCGLTHTMVTPLDVIKCRMQTNPVKFKGVGSSFRITIAEEGAAGLFRGWAPTLFGYSMQGLCKFGFYEYFKIKYSDWVGEEAAYTYRTFVHLGASASAEFIAGFALSPMESVKVRMQTMEGYAKTLRVAAPKMMGEGGVSLFYRPLIPLWARQIPYTMVKFASFERIIELLYANVIPKPRAECSKAEQLVVTFTAGYMAGVLCAVVSHPADTLVSKMSQDRGTPVATLISRLGFWGLWKGLSMRIVMIGTLTGLQWFIYDGVKVWLHIPRPPPPSPKPN